MQTSCGARASLKPRGGLSCWRSRSPVASKQAHRRLKAAQQQGTSSNGGLSPLLPGGLQLVLRVLRTSSPKQSDCAISMGRMLQQHVTCRSPCRSAVHRSCCCFRNRRQMPQLWQPSKDAPCQHSPTHRFDASLLVDVHHALIQAHVSTSDAMHCHTLAMRRLESNLLPKFWSLGLPTAGTSLVLTIG